MRILVVSDTHGDCSRVYEIYKKLSSEAPVDIIVHCGDFSTDALEIQARLGIHAAWVKGNCDGCFDDDNWSILETEAGNFIIVHGHMENVSLSQQNLYYKALENGCIGALYGHTHRGVYTQLGDVYMMNPGSLSRPRDGSGGTFGLLVTGEGAGGAEGAAGSVWGKIYRYEDFMSEGGSGGCGGQGSAKAKPKVQGGYLKGLLNYSDRF